MLAVDEAGRFVIPLLSGHKGGANAFARTVAGCLGATPVITTASDVMGGLSLDLLEEAFGWTASPRERLKPVARSLVDGEPMAVIQEIGCPGNWLDEIEIPANVTVVRDPLGLAGRTFAYFLWITDRMVRDTGAIGSERVLWYRPESLVLGVGCERGISAAAWRTGWHAFSPNSVLPRDSIAPWPAWTSRPTRRACSSSPGVTVGRRSFTAPKNWLPSAACRIRPRSWRDAWARRAWPNRRPCWRPVHEHLLAEKQVVDFRPRLHSG